MASATTKGRHLFVSRRGLDKGPIDEALEPFGLERKIVTIVGGFLTALALARASDLIATVPERHTGNLHAGMHSFPPTVDENGVGGQTPVFHAVTQFNDRGLPVAQLLVERGADLSIRAKLPGYYERPDEVVECTPLGYALLFPGEEGKTVTLLREQGAAE